MREVVVAAGLELEVANSRRQRLSDFRAIRERVNHLRAFVHVDRVDLLARPAGALRELVAILKHFVEAPADHRRRRRIAIVCKPL